MRNSSTLIEKNFQEFHFFVILEQRKSFLWERKEFFGKMRFLSIVRMFSLHHGRFFFFATDLTLTWEKQKMIVNCYESLLTWYYHDLTLQRVLPSLRSAESLLNNFFFERRREKKIFLIKFVSCVVCLVRSFNYKRLIIWSVSRGGKRRRKKKHETHASTTHSFTQKINWNV